MLELLCPKLRLPGLSPLRDESAAEAYACKIGTSHPGVPLLQVRKSLCGSLISCHTAINQQVEPRLFVPRVHLGLAISHPEPRLPSGCLSGVCGVFSFSLATFLPPPL